MIDWTRVSELRDEIGAEDFGEVVEIFIEEVDEGVAALKAGVDETELESKLHFLKGSALNLGFSDFASLCQKGEQAAADGAYDQIDLGVVLASYDASKHEFISSLESRFAA